MLTGKCKEKFERWYLMTQCELESLRRATEEEWESATKDIIQRFRAWDFNMKYGVYEEFFDSLNINIWVYTSNSETWHGAVLQETRYLSSLPYSKSRHEARKAAIEKANEIYNETK